VYLHLILSRNLSQKKVFEMVRLFILLVVVGASLVSSEVSGDDTPPWENIGKVSGGEMQGNRGVHAALRGLAQVRTVTETCCRPSCTPQSHM